MAFYLRLSLICSIAGISSFFLPWLDFYVLYTINDLSIFILLINSQHLATFRGKAIQMAKIIIIFGRKKSFFLKCAFFFHIPHNTMCVNNMGSSFSIFWKRRSSLWNSRFLPRHIGKLVCPRRRLMSEILGPLFFNISQNRATQIRRSGRVSKGHFRGHEKLRLSFALAPL